MAAAHDPHLPRAWSPQLALLHPLFWFGLGALLLNDHVLKHAGVLPGAVTGKLSDFAGLVVAPAVLAALSALAGARSRRVWMASHLAVGLGFAAVKLWPPAATAMGQAMSALGIASRVWCDPTDLMALPALWASFRVLGRPTASQAELRALGRLVLGRAALAAGLLGCVATSRMPPPRVVGDEARAYVPLNQLGQLAVVDGTTGREVRRIDRAFLSYPAPAAVDGMLVGMANIGGDIHLVGVEVTSGVERYARQVRDGGATRPLLRAGPLVLALHRLDVDDTAWELAAYEAKTGAVRWTHRVPDFAQMTLHVRDDVVLVGRQGALARLDAATGARRWEAAVPGEIVSLTWLAGRAFVQLDDELVLAFDDASGRLLAKQAVPDARSVEGWTTNEGSLTASDRALFLLVDGGALVLDADLRTRGRVADVERITAAGEVVLVLRANELRRVDAATGALRWSTPTPLWDEGVSIQGGLALAPGDDDVLAFELTTGRLRWRWVYPHARNP